MPRQAHLQHDYAVPLMPSNLSSVAQAEWKRVIKLLEKIQFLSTADGPLLASYCLRWARFEQIGKEISKDTFQFWFDYDAQKPASNPLLQSLAVVAIELTKAAETLLLSPRGRKSEKDAKQLDDLAKPEQLDETTLQQSAITENLLKQIPTKLVGPPAWISGEAASNYVKTFTPLAKKQYVTPLDRAVMTACVVLADTECRINEILEKSSPLVYYERGGVEREAAHPLIESAKQISSVQDRVASQIGGSFRARMSLPPVKAETGKRGVPFDL